MDPTEPDVVEDGSRRDVRGRRRVGAAERERLLAELGQSGLTLRAFAAREGLNYHTLLGWRARSSRASRDAEPVGASSEAEAPRSEPSAVSFAQVRWAVPTEPSTMSAGQAEELEVRLGEGIVVRCASPGQAAELLKALGWRC
ncbi:MAG: hypothetical protein E1N59_2965 [Puniceicoccaceae bacterium 5H]|nr:MAG: hypothetical protein E1N59_2965 [Puniceicoccaceae bacterium 5H]